MPKEGDGVKLLFQLEDPVSEPRHHLDLYTSNRHEEVNRILKLGATIPEWDYPDDANWTVLVDTEGNPFCLADR